MNEKNVFSKTTRELQKQFNEAALADLQKIVGCAFLYTEEGDNDDDQDIESEYFLVESIDKGGFIVGTSIAILGDEVSIEIGCQTTMIDGDPISNNVFISALDRASDIIQKKIKGLKGE